MAAAAASSWVAGTCPAPWSEPGSRRPTRPRPPLRLVVAGPVVAAPHRRAHLTRRGRLVAGAATLAAAVGITLASGPPAPGASATGTVTVTVRSGQTLSEIAAAELPELPVRAGVTELQLLNGLSSSQVQAGQTLRVPRRTGR